MKFRNAEYLKKSKARRKMQHPTDLKTFLLAELDICQNKVVKQHIQKTLEALENAATRPAPEA
jgi:hypothetical protein